MIIEAGAGGFLDDVITRVRKRESARPRSTQAEVGWSEVGGCRAALGFRLAGDLASDDTDGWGAARGTAIHALMEEIHQGVPGVRAEVTTSYRGILGHSDLLVIDGDEIWDWKGLALTTPLPTPDGWTTMGAVSVGDELLSSDGEPCQVMAKSAVKRIGTYVVRFGDSSEVTCDREHLWWVTRCRKDAPTQVVGVQDLARHLKKGRQAAWRVPVAEPLILPERELPVNPYALGAWLGDGSTGCGRISGRPEIFAEIEREGFRFGPVPPSQEHKVAPFRTAYGLMTHLRQAGVLFDKHVPDAYLRASASQRHALVQGLMDTDGTWNKTRSRAVFETTSKPLTEAMRELLLASGEKPHVTTVTRRGFGLVVEAHMVEWAPRHFNPFRIASKARLVGISEQQITKARFRTIASIEPGPDVETACVAVDSADCTYLCGPDMIPTHNTTKLSNSDLWRKSESALWEKRVQVNGYAAGLIEQGAVGEDAKVGLVVIPVDGTFADWWAWQEPFDRSLADWGADRLEWVRDRMAAGEPLPKDMPYAWCRDWCPFFSMCRDSSEAEAAGEITDPELVAAVAAYGEAAQQVTALGKEKDRLAQLIRGLRGTAGDWRISMSREGDKKEVLDEGWIRADYEARGEAVPVVLRPGATARLNVTRVRKAGVGDR